MSISDSENPDFFAVENKRYRVDLEFLVSKSLAEKVVQKGCHEKRRIQREKKN
jgi:hypothetical protein